MNRQFRIVALLIALVSAWPICHAQQAHTVAFSYDLDGNRTNREILFGRMERTGEASEELLPSATDFFETMEVSLYPNPTNDKFFVELIRGECKRKSRSYAYPYFRRSFGEKNPDRLSRIV